MTQIEQSKAAKKFSEDWKDKGYEKGESQPFWMALLRTVFGISEPEKYILRYLYSSVADESGMMWKHSDPYSIICGKAGNNGGE